MIHSAREQTPPGSPASPAGRRTLLGVVRSGEKWVRRVLGVTAGAILLGLVIITVVDVVGRALFATPLKGSYELSQLAVVASVYLGLAYAESTRSHIKIDILYEWLGRRARTALSVFASVVTLVVVGLLGLELIEYAGHMQQSQRVTGVLGIPYHLAVWIAVVGVGAYVLATTLSLIDHLAARDGGANDAAVLQAGPL